MPESGLDGRAHPVGQRFGDLGREIDPDRRGAAGGVNHARLSHALDRAPAFKAAASGAADIHLHQHIVRILQLLVEIAEGVDDDDPFTGGVDRATQ